MASQTSRHSHSTAHYTCINRCRSCGSDRLTSFLDYGLTPLADQLVPADEQERDDILAPLTLAFCQDCSLVQILETVDPAILFGERYVYLSSVSPTLMRHTQQNVDELVAARGLTAESLVVEPASNDGYLLRRFMEHDVQVLGIDPAPGPASRAQAAGVPTLQRSFGIELARELTAQGKHADVIVANNVLAHVVDLNGFVEGMATLLKPDGLISIEVPYLVDLLRKHEFDTVYHQHLCYFSVTALDRLFRSHGLYVNDVVPLQIHGGSIRLHVEKQERQSEIVRNYMDAEARKGLREPTVYHEFATDSQRVRQDLRALLADLKRRGASIMGYGAAAKATTLMAYCGIGQDWLDYVADLNPTKLGRYMPGNRLRIEPVEALLRDQPDYVLLLAWNFTDEIIEQQTAFLQNGGRFIVPIPEPHILHE